MKIFDLHCDTLLKLRKPYYSINDNNGHISEKSLIDGDYLAQCFAIYIPPEIRGKNAFCYFNEQYELFKNTVNNSNILEYMKTQKDIYKNSYDNKVSCILTAENSEFLNNDLNNLNLVKEYNIKILGLIHNGENCIGFPNSFNSNAEMLPLKPFGKDVVESLNSFDTFIDVSHLNIGGFNDVITISKKPIVATHSCCRNLCDHPRNLYDYQIREIAETGGLIGINYYSIFLNGTNITDITDIIRHISHLIKIGGEDVVALGSDFDGIDNLLPFNNCGDIQLLCDELVKNFGFSIAEKICYKNAIGLFKTGF